ncbi:unnamed protein product, partial [Phaeothamnion confervicola]
GEAECWYELADDDGKTYYFNTRSGMSVWEPPEWVDEIDPETSCTYYIN